LSVIRQTMTVLTLKVEIVSQQYDSIESF